MELFGTLHRLYLLLIFKHNTNSLRTRISNSVEVVTPFMQDVTYSSRNIATLGPLLTDAVTLNTYTLELEE